ncbi:dimethylargininase [Corynebacterium uterequi]|uniref:N-dimethylarginine dimethylaminohydrolase n=1 Tax=Corynebacterium uterequi TaxID=1072256 RepID=A0A0G3HD12_9CORY|nr:dimethylargininase [Corynebacterium uterequi]AKK11251.1 N-dimethylarginine dimethylaminohydrolase [Corynebacterium uterequi]
MSTEAHHALIRRPSPLLADGIVTHIDRSPVDLELAHQQWSNYVAALHDAGWTTTEVTPADDCPDSVFIEDAVVVYDDIAVITRPGADSRKPETPGAEDAVRALGYDVRRITTPGTLDGGDVLKFGGTVWVGIGGRTNEEGVRQLGEILAEKGATTVGVPLTKVLHLKTAVTALPDGTVIGYEPLVDDVSVWEKFLAVPEESGAHVVLLGGNRLLMAADAPRTAALFRQQGYDVVEVDISEFEKLEGCVTCLSVRLRGMPSAV